MNASIDVINASVSFQVYRNKSPALKEAVIEGLTGKKLPKVIDEFHALQNINLHIGEGVRLGLLGLNGAGKSTLLKMIVGIYPPQSGKIKVCGRITPLIELGTGFDMELSGRENIYLNGALLGRSFDDMHKLEEEIIDFCGLTQFIDVPVKYYSSGMYARLAFSIGTLVEPEILVLDEVFASGDAKFVRKASQRILDMVDRAQIVIMASHDIEQIKSMCNRAILIHNGQIIQDGEPESVTNYYVNEIAV